MEPRPAMYASRPGSRPHEGHYQPGPPPQYAAEHPPAMHAQPPPPPPQTLQQDPFYRPRRQTFESIAASTPRPDTRGGQTYPPGAPYNGQPDPYPRHEPLERREGYGLKRSHDQALGGDQVENGRQDPPRIHELHPAPAPHQHAPSYSFSPPHNPRASGAPAGHPPIQHAHDHPKLNNGQMYQASAPRSPPPPSPYGGRLMLPPGSPPYAPPHYGPHGPPSGPLPPPPFSRDPGAASHRPGSGMSIANMLGGDLPKPPQEPRYAPANGAPANGQTAYTERDGQRGGQPGLPPDLTRSQTPDGYRPRQYDYTRPSRAYSGGEMPPRSVPHTSPDKFGFGPPLPPAHEHPIEHRIPPPPPALPPHHSAPQSRRASIGAPPVSAHQHTGSLGGHGLELHHQPAPLHLESRIQPHPQGPPQEHDPRNGYPDHQPWPDAARRPATSSYGESVQSLKNAQYTPFADAAHPQAPPQEQDVRNGYPDRQPWPDAARRPATSSYGEGVQSLKDAQYTPFADAAQHQQHHQPPPPPPLPPHALSEPVDLPRNPEMPPLQTNGHGQNGHGPVFGPAPNPAASAPPEPIQRIPLDGRKASVESISAHLQGRLESPLQRHRHLMDRANSTSSEHGSRLLSLSADARRRAASPLPQAVHGAKARQKGPAAEPSIKNEFGRMFAGLGGVTPTPTPVELVHKRYSSPAEEPERRDTPLAGRLDLGTKRTASRIGKRGRGVKEDGETDSPGVELQRSFSSKGAKKPRTGHTESTSPILHRTDTSSPFSAGIRRTFTPTASRMKLEKRPRTIVHSKAVLDSVRNKERQHLGSMLYTTQVAPERLRAGEDGSRFGFVSTPIPMPRFEEKENCTFTIRVPRYYLTRAGREEICERRALWGTDVYTDDSDAVAAAIHSGWIRGEWAGDLDISPLSLGQESARNSMSVSPELARRSLATPALANGLRKSLSVEVEKDPNVMSSPPKEPVVPPKDKDAHITVLVLPQLQQYAGSVQNGVKSRAWSTQHDGVSFKIHRIQWVDEGRESRRAERGAQARHARLRNWTRIQAMAGAAKVRASFGLTAGGQPPSTVAVGA